MVIKKIIKIKKKKERKDKFWNSGNCMCG